MFRSSVFFVRLWLVVLVFLLPHVVFSQTTAAQPEIPAPLKMWESWATWDDPLHNCPTAYESAEKPLGFWPSRLSLGVDANGGRFDLDATVFAAGWIPLPGGGAVWPVAVTVDGVPAVVVEHDGAPSIQMSPGLHQVGGNFRWSVIPANLKLPREIGILALSVEGSPVTAPGWTGDGVLWLRRDRSSEETSRDFISSKIYAVLEDGIPLWLRTRIELVVAGKSREEDIGHILPEGWKLLSLSSPMPIAVDENGRLKAQVRAGKWTIEADAFNLQDLHELRFAAGTKPAAMEELIAFRPKPDFRLVEIAGAPSIDVSQTTFPDQWRDLAVYRWETATEIKIAERMRGMGLQKPAGLSIMRKLWLDENGGGFTFRDTINGLSQQIWRLDAAPGQDLGSVRAAGQGQLITRNPQTGATGFEVRNRNINFEATGRVERKSELSASGWLTDAELCQATLNLPPGWRLFAVFGADYVHGDWLTAWTLLDLFLLLIFSLAVWKLWGLRAALLAFLAFGLSYHESGAPRYLWLLLLVPLALLRVVPVGWKGRPFLLTGKWLAVLALTFILLPFLARQVQQALYPQLEQESGMVVQNMGTDASTVASSGVANEADASSSYAGSYVSSLSRSAAKQSQLNSNLVQDLKARIQTGPGVPEWSWRSVSFGWNGPVSATQNVRVVLLSLTIERLLTIARVILLLGLAAVLLGGRRLRDSLPRASKAAVAMMCFLLATIPQARAQFPDQPTIETLRKRLLEPSDAYPHAADIPSVALVVKDNRLLLDAEIHAAIRTAVPLPGRLPVWSPVSVQVDGKPEVSLRRDDGFLWVVLEKGVHQVHVEGLLPGATEWEWTFHLAPRHATIDAPGWTVTGLKPDGTPEAQIFFALKQKSATGEASYDSQDLQPLVSVERHLELGLTWQIHTTVKRLSPAGKALSLRIPLLPGENILSAILSSRDGALDLRLSAQAETASWESELPISGRLPLATRSEDTWVESWFLVASPIWNIGLVGLAPVFQPDDQALVPVWHPWPGEKTELVISRPEAVSGPTITVSRGTHDITLGKRQRVSRLDLSLLCSLGEDFWITLPPEAEITALSLQGRLLPVRKEGAKVIVPLSPGEQAVSLSYKTNIVLGTRTSAENVVLPVESANITSVIHLPADRWVLWADGPRRGPAVRFWVILICSLLGALALARVPHSPLRRIEWLLLAIGLTQVPLPAAMFVVAWLFCLAWRGREPAMALPRTRFNLLQILLIFLTLIALGVVIAVVGEGLLGSPEMFISGNGSSPAELNWYLARSGTALPQPGCFSVSIWWYRFFMLLWALWLAASLIRWLQWAWQQFSKGGCWKATVKSPPPIPAIPPAF